MVAIRSWGPIGIVMGYSALEEDSPTVPPIFSPPPARASVLRVAQWSWPLPTCRKLRKKAKIVKPLGLTRGAPNLRFSTRGSPQGGWWVIVRYDRGNHASITARQIHGSRT